ncbi:GNAT family N-acetyltransferase [Catellatospora sp. NPDC049111]|uniref:GNAT family N-acetyltransferase n=1 Tax=Catellatospora sp. NPDC049111 TaxID=3155271 RepID=UPI0033CE1B8B
MTPVDSDVLAEAWSDAIRGICETTPQGWYAEQGNVRAGVTRTAIPSLNVAFSISPDPDLTSLEDLAAEVGRLGVPWSVIVRGAGDEVADLAARHGLLKRGGLPVMACAAEDAVLVGDERRSWVHAIDAAASDIYTDTLTAGFEVPDGTFGTLMGGRVLDSPGVTGYLADESGVPVGTGLGYCGRGTVGVFNIAVVPSSRGRGVGRALTARVMADGFGAGARVAYLNPSADGWKLYESMGFRLVETWAMFTAA